MDTHRLYEELLQREVRVMVIGCGGNGSAIVAGLPYLHSAMLAQGHPFGLHVTVMDGDNVRHLIVSASHSRGAKWD